jgi:hypothetical protein
MTRLKTGLVATLAATCMVFTAVAEGHNVKYDSAVTAKYNKATKSTPASFDGTVTSAKPRCAKGRTVNLRLRTTDGSTVVATDLTDANGLWATEVQNLQPGTYFAEVTRKVLRKTDTHRHVCKKAFSKDIKVSNVK